MSLLHRNTEWNKAGIYILPLPFYLSDTLKLAIDSQAKSLKKLMRP